MKGIMGQELVMPPRAPDDGPIGIRKDRGEYVLLTTQCGVESELRVSPHNAWRLFGSLALMLGIPLPKAIGRLIRL